MVKQEIKNEIKAVCEYVMLNGERTDWSNVIETLNAIYEKHGMEKDSTIHQLIYSYNNCDNYFDDKFNVLSWVNRFGNIWRTTLD